jgi:hypothetical protein
MWKVVRSRLVHLISKLFICLFVYLFIYLFIYYLTICCSKNKYSRRVNKLWY